MHPSCPERGKSDSFYRDTSFRWVPPSIRRWSDEIVRGPCEVETKRDNIAGGKKPDADVKKGILAGQ